MMSNLTQKSGSRCAINAVATSPRKGERKKKGEGTQSEGIAEEEFRSAYRVRKINRKAKPIKIKTIIKDHEGGEKSNKACGGRGTGGSNNDP